MSSDLALAASFPDSDEGLTEAVAILAPPITTAATMAAAIDFVDRTIACPSVECCSRT